MIYTNLKNKIVSLVVLTAVVVIPFRIYAATLNRQLDEGMTGTDVSSLQSFLAQDESLYPQGLVTGYYGFLTKSAVSNFQSRNNIPAVGRVGPVTLPVLNSQMMGGMMNTTTNGHAPTIYNVSLNTNRNNATVSWTTDETSRGVVYYSSSPLVTAEHLNSVDVSGNAVMTDMNYRSSQNVSLQNLDSNTTYYYMIYVTDQDGNVSVTSPREAFRTSN